MERKGEAHEIQGNARELGDASVLWAQSDRLEESHSPKQRLRSRAMVAVLWQAISLGQ